jgi:hypothetical protein
VILLVFSRKLKNRPLYHNSAAWFNHLSNSTQGCAGKELALFIAERVVAELLRVASYRNRKRCTEPGQPVPGSCNPFAVELERVPLAEKQP